MKDTKIPLDIIFLDEDLEVILIKEGVPTSEEPLSEIANYVLELNKDSGVEIGDSVIIKYDKNTKTDSKMLVLDSNGEVQMKLEGGERIFSRKHTKTLIQFAKKASITNKDNDYVALGKRMFKFLEAQQNAEPEYVKSKN